MDHEICGAQEWHLPGYGRAPAKKPAAAPSPPEPIPPTSPKALNRSSQPVVAVREAPAVRGRAGARGRATNTRGTTASQPSGLFRDSPSKAKWRNGSKPTGVVELHEAFGSFKDQFFGAARNSTFGKKTALGHGRNEVFEDISKRTGAFVKPPQYHDRHIQIWGDANQFALARDLIKALIAKCVTKTGQDWTKIKAHSVKKVENAELKERGDNWLLELRKAPDSGTTFPETFAFLWPKDGPSIHDCLGPELEALDAVRVKFGCPIYVSKEMPGYICAIGNNHDSIKQIAGSIRVIWAEAVFKNSIKTKLYLVEPPQPSFMRAEIHVKEENRLHKPALRGKYLSGENLEKWKARVELLRSDNNTRLLAVVENCLKGLSFVRGHLRMRVNLGTFVLENYLLPEDNRAWFGLQEFREMMFHEEIKGRLIPELKVDQRELLERVFQANDFLEPIDSSAELKDADLAYSVNFEFHAADKSSMLRLEAEFAKSPGAREYEIKERRWLRPRTKTGDHCSPLHVAVIDFGRSDWQLEIKSLEFHETSSIDRALKTFSNSIGFKHMENEGDISAAPKRKVTFPAGSPVSRVVEKSAMRFRVKGTNYIFEISRYDEYKRTETVLGQTGVVLLGGIAEVPFTTWGASVFEANWDNLLGGHANLASGQSAKYTPNLATFFPPMKAASAVDDQAKGFWEFIDLVKNAADLLGPTRKPPGAIEAFNTPGGVAFSPEAEPKGMLSPDIGTLF
ncbi:hypothetical protein BDV18DRAFT_157334 [Aspergillus unguis]